MRSRTIHGLLFLSACCSCPMSFAQDKETKVEQWLTTITQPDAKRFLYLERNSRPQPWPSSARIESPSIALVAQLQDLIKLPGTLKVVVIAPRALPPLYPLAREMTVLALPDQPRLEVSPLPTYPGPDLSQPVPLPNIARQKPDRASLADPTAEASTSAVLSPTDAVRVTPTPFVPLNLPDPFPNRLAQSFHEGPPETGTLPILPVRPPVK